MDGLAEADVRSEAFVEISHAHDCHDHSDDEQEECEDRKRGQAVAGGFVKLRFGRVVHAHEFEGEVGHGGEVDRDDGDLAGGGLALGDPGGEEEEDDGDGDGGDCEPELGWGCTLTDYDEELDCEAQEEEKVELQ